MPNQQDMYQTAQPHTAHRVAPLAIVLAALLGIAGVVYLLTTSAANAPTTGVFATPPPPPSPQIVEALKNSTGFNALVSYVGTAFEPESITIMAGQTIRFVNNSASDLALCGNAFNCTTINPKGFREITFSKTGTWNYQNKLQPDARGTITVQ